MNINRLDKFNRSILDNVKISEVSNFLNYYNNIELENIYTKTPSTLFYSVESEEPICTELLTRSCACKTYANDRINATNLFDFVTKEPIELANKMNLNDVLLFCKDLARDDLFYGVLCVDDNNNRINPFHPLVAKYFTGNNYDESILYRVIIFAFREQDRTSTFVNNALTERDLHEDLFVDNISKQIQLSEKNINVGNRISGNISDIREEVYEYVMSEKEIQTERISKLSLETSENDIRFLIPCQILSNRIGIPYYGSVLIKYDKEGHFVQGSQITPMCSPNLGSNSSGEEIGTIYEDSVCTGDILNTNVEGLQRFNVANLDSPYFRKVLENDWFKYTKVSIEFALNLYNSCPYLMDPNVNKPYKQIWLEEHPSLTEFDFMQHLRDRVLTAKQGEIDEL